MLFAISGANAQDGTADRIDTLDVTMTLMPEGATLPDAVTKVIELPEAAAAAAEENAAPGTDTANAARANREAGLEVAADAREQGREFGQQMADQAQENRENAGRGNPPDSAGPPDVPGAPNDLPNPANPPGPPAN
jgi:hypothetical protein